MLLGKGMTCNFPDLTITINLISCRMLSIPVFHPGESFRPFARIFWGLSFLLASLGPAPLSAQTGDSFEYIAHRGVRGIFPENSIPGFQLALSKGADMLEMDVLVTRDNQVLLSHDPVISEELCSHSGNAETSEEERIIYGMTYEEIQAYTCGENGHPKFPEQEKAQVAIPLLGAVIDSCMAYAQANGLPTPAFDVELKFSQKMEGLYYPEKAAYVSLVLDVLNKRDVLDRCVLTSFDEGILQTIHQQSPQTKVGLIMANLKGVKGNLKRLGFVPDYLVAYHKLISRRMVREAREKGIEVVAWTVNSRKQIDQLRKKGVTSIISDYPGLVN